MNVELTDELLADVQEALGLPHTALVEKDYHVVSILSTLSQFTQGSTRLVFGGGTALCRAHRLIGRMSEDIDLKMVSDDVMGRSARKAFRERVMKSLTESDFKVLELRSHDEYRTHVFKLAYAATAPSVGSLRPEIKVELSSWPLYLPPIDLPIQSFVAQARQEDAEIPAFPCSSILETAAEKFVALTRRIGEERCTGNQRDRTLLRHVYDLYRIVSTRNSQEIASLISQIIPSDQETRGNRYPAYAKDPMREIASALEALSTDKTYAIEFEQFQRDMVYDQNANFAECLEALDLIWFQVQSADLTVQATCCGGTHHPRHTTHD